MSTQTIHLPLAVLDHLPPPNYTCSTFYLPTKSGISPENVFSVLQRSLHNLFGQLPYLNGKIFPQSPLTQHRRPGQLEIRYTPTSASDPPPYQLKFRKATNLTYADLKEAAFPLDSFEDSELIWVPFIPDLSSGVEVFVAQATFLPTERGGGCLLTAALHHCAGDGMAAFTVVNLWAEHCRAIQDGGTPPPAPASECYDREIQERIWKRERPATKDSAEHVDEEVWKMLGLNPKSLPPHLPCSLTCSCRSSMSVSDPTIPRANGTSVAVSLTPRIEDQQQQQQQQQTQPPLLKSFIYYISPSNFSALQKDNAKSPSGATPTIPISSTHAICGLVWRCLLRARFAINQQAVVKTASPSTSNSVKPSHKTAYLDMILDGRSGFSDSLPQNYLGNHTVTLQSQMPLKDLTTPIASTNDNDTNSIASSAASIALAASRITTPRLHAMLHAISLLSSYDSLRKAKRERQAAISPTSLMITSMLMAPFKSVNFGGKIFGNDGNPECVRPLMGAFERLGVRICFVMPRTESGGVELVINVTEEEREWLEEDEEWGKYVMLLA